MRILVTGGLGVNGAVVRRQLIERGLRPVVLDQRADFSLLSGAPTRFNFVEGDITDFAFVTGLFSDQAFYAVIHLAAFIAPDMDARPYQSFRINSQGTAYLLQAAQRSGVRRFIMASSRAVYGRYSRQCGWPRILPHK